MTFVIQRVIGRDTVLSQIAADALRIGRGTNCQLRSENPAVALVHAEIESGAAGYTIIDKGSVTGTYVNRKPIETALLSKNDIIEIGDLLIEVQLADAGKPMFLRVGPLALSAPVINAGRGVAATPLGDETMPGRGAMRAEKIDYAGAYRLRRPYLTKLAVTAFLLIITLAVIGEVSRPERQTLFMPGTVSSAHMRARDANGDPIVKNCGACHDPWRSVSNTKCKACHGRAPHAERESAPPNCMSCHAEHRAQPKLAMIADVKCVSCHGDLPAHIAGSAPPMISAHITGFGIRHPEFEPIADHDTLRFNHKLHLRRSGILNANGQREVLLCTACHRLIETRGKVDPAPLRFTGACQRCHKLTFDDRFPDLEIPHGGDPGLVYGFIVTTYTGSSAIAGKSPDEIRRILTTRPPTSVDERAVLNAEQVIKTKCQYCHQLERRKRLAVTPPILPMLWLQHANFSHTAHRNIDCQSCHDRARTSAATADVLIPKQETCMACHGPQAVKIPTSCATCHVYHERSKILMTSAAIGKGRRSVPPSMPPTGDLTGMLQNVLLYGIVILMLVIMIPVALALFTRLKASGDRAPATRSPAASAPAPSRVPPAKTAAEKPEAKKPAPAPSRPVPPPIEAPVPTQLIDLQPEVTTPRPTEMVQWYGMLTCTVGPMTGQTFTIEDGGLWIGRDPNMAQIVINDGRISKRHVRVIPRNGRVYAIDEDSTNGTFIDKLGERITEVQLKSGNTIILADNAASFLYRL